MREFITTTLPRAILLFVLVLLSLNSISAQLNPAHLSVAYDVCTNSLTVKYRYRDVRGCAVAGCCYDTDRMGWLEIKYVQGTVEKGLFLGYGEAEKNRVDIDVAGRKVSWQNQHPGIDFNSIVKVTPDAGCGHEFGILAPNGATLDLSAGPGNINDSNGPRGAVAVIPMPEFTGEQLTLKINGSWFQYSSCCLFGTTTSAFWSSGDFTLTTTNNGLNQGATVTSVSNNLCDEVRVEWTNPTVYDNTCQNPQANWYNVLYANGTPINVGQADFYVDRNVTKGVEKDYQIRTFWGRNAYTTNESELSSTRKGNSLGIPDPPVITNVGSSGCANANGGIVINWTNPITTLDSISIQRSTDPSFNTNNKEFRIDANDGLTTTYTDNTADEETTYYYRMRSINICGDVGNYNTNNPPFEGRVNGIPVAPSGVTAVPGDNKIVISWIDESSNETGFEIWRSVDGNNSLLKTVSALNGSGGRITEDDTQIEACKEYNYTVRSINTCDESSFAAASIQKVKTLLDIDDAFTAPGGSFTASKGYFTNRVELKWTLANNAQSVIQNYNIERRILGSGDDFVLLQQVSGGGIYNDIISDAGILYEYRITGSAQCGTDLFPVTTIPDTAIGFRNKASLVTGNVSYEGGNAVRDVKIQAESTASGIGKSVQVNGGSISIAHNPNQDLDSTFVFESWIKPSSYATDFEVIKKQGSFELIFQETPDLYRFEVGINDFITFSQNSFPLNQWSHLGVQVSDSLYIYRNGEVLVSKPLSSNNLSIINNTSPIILFDGFQGNITELRLWNIPKDSVQMIRDATRHVVGDEKGVFCFLPMNEGSGSFLYDRSKRSFSTFNKNDGRLFGGATFTSDIPTLSQLSYAAYTDTVGNYIISLPYTNAGESYELTPIYFTHEFDPIKRQLYVGDGQEVINNVDFLDKSSFLVTGIVKYEGTNCFVKNAQVKIDGEIRVVNGSVVKTNENGYFEVQVPIGLHYLEIEKEGHTFSRGRYPQEEGEAADFQQPLNLGEYFLDNTQIRLVGRAVGGSREAEKTPVIGGSVNNIGITRITLSHNTCGWETGIETNPYRLDTIIYTDSLSGVYDVSLPPWVFGVTDLKRKNEVITPNDFFGSTIEDIDLRYEVEDGLFQNTTTEYDTTLASITSTDPTIDSIKYEKERNFVHFAAPAISVENKDGTNFYGETSFKFTHSQYPTDTVNFETDKPLFPVVFSDVGYAVNIRLFEEYVNIDQQGFTPDRVPIIRGKLLIDNKLAKNEFKDFGNDALDTLQGTIPYEFIGGSPNVLESEVDPNYSFTKIFNITYEDPNEKDTKWLPFERAIPLGTNNPSANFRAYVFGGIIDEGTNHTVAGPNEVEYILRDPAVGNGFASITKGVTTNEFTNWTVSAGGGTTFNKAIKLGPKIKVGIGKITSIDVENTFLTQIEAGGQLGASGNTQTVREYTRTISTSDIANNIGDGSDLFIGTSNIYLFGTSTDIGLFPIEACDDGAAGCFGAPIGNYRLGKSRNYALQDKTLDTEFILTKTDIVNYEIPLLKTLRDELLKKDSLYVSVIQDTLAQNYGKNNDDEVFGNEACRCYHWESNNPPSYRFLGHRDSLDKVRKFNEDIANWEAVLAANERDKLESTKVVKRLSFDGGGSTTEFSSTVSNIVNKAFTWEVTFQEGLYNKIGATTDGIGAEIEQSIFITQASTGDKGTETDSTTTIAYTFKDEDIWDRYTVEVIESNAGWGPIFKIVSGETSCPHVGPLISAYHNPGTELSGGTIQLEQPVLTVDNPVLRNVPEDDVAEFVFRLGNNSSQGWAYRLGLLNQSNTGGAIIVNSGTSELGSDFVIGSQQEISQVIQIVKGGAYKNDSLLFVLASTCQYDIGNDFDEDIADSVYVSVFFTPECSDISLVEPADNWVLNVNFNDTMKIVVGDYNVNQQGFESFNIQYKESNNPTWNTLNTYFLNKEDFDNSTLTNKDTIDLNANGTQFQWSAMKPFFPDTEYDLRATATCVNDVISESSISSGYMDRDRIEVFGTPSPGDGILEPNDDILLTMNETIEKGGIGSGNFEVRGVLNGTELRHDNSLSFDGVNSFATIPEYQLQGRSMTIEFWLRRTRLGKEVVLSQGTSPTEYMQVSFTSQNKLRFDLGDAFIESDFVVDTFDWKHYAITYEDSTNIAEIIIADLKMEQPDYTPKPFFPNYSTSSEIQIGKSLNQSLPLFKGFIHELRLWSQVQSLSDVNAFRNVTMSGREVGLIGNWPMDEAFGQVAFDKVRSRHAQLSGTTWSILPQNHSFAFNGTTDYLFAKGTGDLTFQDEVDLTFEVWFKTGSNKEQVLFSNGRANGLSLDSIPIEDKSWKVFLNSLGNVIIQSNGNQLATDLSYNDDNWHHLSAVIERTRSTSIYIDGELVKTGNSSNFKGFSAAKLYVGALGFPLATRDSISSFFNGHLDDLRIWNLARRPEQVKRDFVNQLRGDELGLQYYYPFDGLKLVGENIEREENLLDGVGQLIDTLGHDLCQGFLLNGTDTIRTGLNFDETIAPPIKLPRLVENANYSYSINDDQIFIEIIDDPARIENVTFDITVRRLRDRAGNYMSGPETWIAYIDKNQVFWDTEYFKFEKKLEDPLSFTARIKNTGGSQERFSLSNLPSWLTASPSSGLIDPNSTVEVEFKVQPLLNIGEYEQDIFVSTESFGFNERLLLDLKVMVDPPVWEVDPDAFDQSMNITGELFINDVISTDPEDMVSVWVNDELRGVSHVEFDPSSGKNLVFLTVLSNVSSGETLEFRAWDASRGRLLKGLMPDDIAFIGGGIINSRTNPLPIKATVLTELTYVLNEGWNWISFPLDHPDLSSVNSVLKELSPTENDQMKSQDQGVAQSFFYSGGSWVANDTSVNTNLGYKIKVAKADTFRYEGTFVDPSTQPIHVVDGWNWIGVKSEFIIDVPSAMASLDPQTGDVIKGQRSFAIYEDGFGWGGNLDFLQPQQGYMLQYHKTDSLYFPGNLNARSKPETHLKSRSHKGKEYARLEKSLNYVSGKYSNTMSLIAAVDDCILLDTEGVLQLSQWSLVAHAGDECRGVVESTWIESIGEYRYYLSIEGNSSVPLTFKLLHNSNGKEIILNQGMNFETNGVVGMNSSPYVFSCVAPSDCINTMLYQNADIDMSQTDITRQVLTELQSNALLPTGRVFRFKAGQSIEFMGEFEVTRGAILEAYIEECIKGNE